MARTAVSVAERKAAGDRRGLEVKAAAHRPRGFAAGLRTRGADGGTAIIAELKKASPSKGVLREDYRPVQFGRAYEAAGAAAISVLTDGPFFQGSLEDLEAVSGAVAIPVLRKDFTLDEYQILEARAAGADAVLLIVAAHTDARLRELGDAVAEMGLDVLCEVHDRPELDRAVGLGFEVIGVNCRNLKTLEVHPEAHVELAQWMPKGVVRVAESGIGSRGDIERLLAAGYGAFLVGETLMRTGDPGAGVTELLGLQGRGRREEGREGGVLAGRSDLI